MDQDRASRTLVLQGILLVLVVVLFFLPAIRAGFIWDDDDYVTSNRTLLDAHGLWRIWFEPGAVPQYYPMVHTSFWIERHLWGLRPAGFHAVNILLHAAACLLFWACLRRMRLPGAWAAAAIYALHPLQVESVAWITERKNVLSGLFFWAAFLLFLKSRMESGPASRQGAEGGKGGLRAGIFGRAGEEGAYGWSLVLFLCGLLSKSATGCLPVAILLALYAKSGRLIRKDAVRLIPFFLLALALGWLTISMEKRSVGAFGPEWALSLPERMGVAGRALWFYLRKLLWPDALAFVYPRWSPAAGMASGLLGLAAFLALLLALFRLRKSLGRGPLAAALIYAAAIFPALGFFNLYPMKYSWVADHYQYLAGAAPIALSAALGAGWLARLGVARWARFLLLGCLLALLGGASFHRTLAFQSEETLWRDNLRKDPHAWMAHHNLGRYYEGLGRTDEAIREYRAALEIRPDLDNSLYNLGNALAARGELEEAEGCLRRATVVNPRFVEAWNNLGNVLYQQRKTSDALGAYHQAILLDPTYPQAHRNLGYALADLGEMKGAVVHLEIYTGLMPDDPVGANRLAWVLATSGDPGVRDGARAVECALRACRITGFKDPGSLATLSAAYAEAGRFPDAIETLRQAMRMVPVSEGQDRRSRLHGWLVQFQAGRPLRTTP